MSKIQTADGYRWVAVGNALGVTDEYHSHPDRELPAD
jgi:hypothetical protein